MEYVSLDDEKSLNDFISDIQEKEKKVSISYCSEGYIAVTDTHNALVAPRLLSQLKHIAPFSEYSNKLIYGKNVLERIVAVEVVADKLQLFFDNGAMLEKEMVYWILSNTKFDSKCQLLAGNNHYKYIKTYPKSAYKYGDLKKLKDSGRDFYTVYDPKEEAMLYYGITMFKGLKTNNISVLSFDIESSGLKHNDDSKVFLITNTFRDASGVVHKKHFRVDHYDDNDIDMIDAWCKWVVEIDPMVITGHNIYGYDLPYLNYCYTERSGGSGKLPIGKHGDRISVANKPSSKRVDGSTEWQYHKISCYGRSIIDGLFLAVNYDIGRKYVSWGLKQIAEQEGFIAPDRQFYDASQIYKNWYIPEEREKIVAYGIADSDDSLALYDLMVPSMFYSTMSVAKPYQTMGTSASGAQINSILVRAYLQDMESIPKAEDSRPVGGGISFGIHGIHKNVMKIDVASLYPSIIRSKKLFSAKKDPHQYYLKMVDFFTIERFKNKKLYKTTKDKYYDDLQASQKVFINSAYGVTGTPGLNFNDFAIANEITRTGREIIKTSIEWATSKKLKDWFPEYDETKDSL